ncbi:uncharacterized protein N7477_007430 [Penicillium maclennaniae]|uniref:uncharacterized protein n=1 Tax=Penicillium maclennaniae TaxID=1343394 RepID=UPI002540B505|nr:uncharacterized protein N7477_007430 [Penicillium maclennaniae]KAJ5664982.1 hypothetical protein N7477_007430 [Penicillium maclennaniae]
MAASNITDNSLAAVMEDPFVSTNGQPPAPRESHRYSPFDTQLFSLNASSPAQAKRALEAHLAETERRLEEASKLGTALIDQQRQLEEQLKEVEQQQDEGEIGPELQQKLADLEREYSEIGRETARAFLAPKRLAGGEDAPPGTPGFDQKSPISPALFASQATNSPSKVSVPSRKQRNQPASRVHDIEFATEISTSLLAQVRQLQALLAEREESLKNVNLEKSRLELEAEAYSQRIRSLDDSEQRYKDENWALETQTHELMATIRDAIEREKKLNSSLSASNSEKSAIERELEELKQVNAKLLEDQMEVQKANDSELHLLRRNLNAGDLEKSALQKKLEELTSQNQELAKGLAMRIRNYESQGSRDITADNEGSDQEHITPESSPPQSPNKFTLVTNLKSTIHREKTEKMELKRMLQETRDEVEQKRREAVAPSSSKRPKTKQDSVRKPLRPDLLGAGRKEKAFVELHDTDWEDNAGQMSPTRPVVAAMPTGRAGARSPDGPSDVYQTATEAEDGFETANERATATESEAFQTGMESMAGDSSDDSADLTETENNIQKTPRSRVTSSLVMAKARDRTSWHSSASTSDDDQPDDGGAPSPSQTHISRPRVRNKRSILRRIRPSGEAPLASISRPGSSRNSPAPTSEQETIAQEGQSLFAELAELEGGEEDEDEEFPEASTPRMGSVSGSRRPSEAIPDSPLRPTTVDSGVMTEPWEPTIPVAIIGEAALPEAPSTPQRGLTANRDIDAEAQETPKLVSSGTQWTPLKPSAIENDHLTNVPTPPKMAWDQRSVGSQGVEAGTQAEPAEMGMATITTQETVPEVPTFTELGISYVSGGVVEPVKHEIHLPEPVIVERVVERVRELPQPALSSLHTHHSIEPVLAVIPDPEPVIVERIVERERELPQPALSSLHTHHSIEPVLADMFIPEPVVVERIIERERELPRPSLSSHHTHHSIEPVLATISVPEPVVVERIVERIVERERDLPRPSLSSHFTHHSTEPIRATIPHPAPVIPVEPMREIPQLSLSSLFTHHSTEPVHARLPEPEPLPEPPVVEAAPLSSLGVSSIVSEHTEPVQPQLPEPVPVPEPVVVERIVERIVEREPTLPQLSVSWLDPTFTHPVAPKKIELPALPSPTIAALRSIETHPIQYVPRVVPPMTDLGIQTDPMEEPTAAAVLVHEDETSDSIRSNGDIPSSERRTSTGLALSDISGHALPHTGRQPFSSVSMDQGAQTILSAKQIDQLLMERIAQRPPSNESNHTKDMALAAATTATAAAAAAAAAAASPYATPKLRPRSQQQLSRSGTPKRPDTATSQASGVSSHPPLPSDHREAILAAEKKSIDVPPPSPGTMGPPLAPASAYRMNVQGPRTPSESANRAGSTKTVSTQAHVRRGSQSQMSRRSSVSSFASELEERFNMNPHAGPMPHGHGPNTDPRMIQAITQTMIGEFLWKYTRKTGSADMSSTRHRRYFWVHPYTRTLYWSESDPQTAGKSELRTKSVPIEARSLEVVSPGRRVRFTASTSQRHETWFNALSYLLLRETNDNCEDHDNNVTLDDIDEFNPGFRSASHQTARMSLSSHNSHTLRGKPKQQRAASAMSMRSTGTHGRASPALSTGAPNSTLQVPEEPPQRSSSRLSSILNSSIRGSIASLKGRHGAQSPSLHNESLRDQNSIENLGHTHDHDDGDRLENVRACCDGKHDVGSLSRTSRYSPRVDRIHSHH